MKVICMNKLQKNDDCFVFLFQSVISESVVVVVVVVQVVVFEVVFESHLRQCLHSFFLLFVVFFSFAFFLIIKFRQGSKNDDRYVRAALDGTSLIVSRATFLSKIFLLSFFSCEPFFLQLLNLSPGYSCSRPLSPACRRAAQIYCHYSRSSLSWAACWRPFRSASCRPWSRRPSWLRDRRGCLSST